MFAMAARLLLALLAVLKFCDPELSGIYHAEDTNKNIQICLKHWSIIEKL